MYVDESGDCGHIIGNGSKTRYFILCGLVLHELKWKEILDSLIDFRKQMKAAFGLRLREEIHSSHLINKPGDLQRIEKFKRLEILKFHADFLAKINEISLIPVIVDKQGKSANYDIFESAWKILIQRFENTIAHRNFPGPRNPDDKGMIFADNTDNKKLMAVLRKMRKFNPIPNQAWAGPGTKNILVSSVIEDPNFRDSRHSYFIQAVDVCTYLLLQQNIPCRYFSNRNAKNYFTRLQPILRSVVSPAAGGIVRL